MARICNFHYEFPGHGRGARGQKEGKEKGKGEEDRVRGGGEGGRRGGPFQFIRRGAISRAERQGSEIRQRVLHNFFFTNNKK